MLGGMSDDFVTFVERAGNDAEGYLASLRERLRDRGVRARLLCSRDQDALRLLVVHGELETDEATLDGCRTWRFRTCAGPEDGGAT